jgi:hypothetical protein
VLARLRSLDDPTQWWLIVGLLAAVVAVPLVLASPGNDLDVANVFRSGRAIARHLDYVPSRPPGAPVHEAIVGVLDLLGGPILTNLASVAAAVGLVWALDRLLAEGGLGPHRRWALALLVANPWFLIAATSTADYVFALLFVVLGARALRAERVPAAGILLALAMGSRVGSATLIAGVLLAELGEGAGARRRSVVAGAVAGVGTALLFIPSVVAAGGLSFAQNDFSTSSPLVQVGRALAKDLLLLGVPAAVVLALLAIPSLVAAIGSWRSSWLVRFSVLALLLSQLLFLRFPWKMAHLLPSLLCLVVLLAVALEDRPRVLVALVATQLAFAVVRVDVIAPDDPGAATSGRIEPGITTGPLVRDWQCRREHPDAYLGRQIEEVEVAWDCAAPYRDELARSGSEPTAARRYRAR